MHVDDAEAREAQQGAENSGTDAAVALRGVPAEFAERVECGGHGGEKPVESVAVVGRDHVQCVEAWQEVQEKYNERATVGELGGEAEGGCESREERGVGGGLAQEVRLLVGPVHSEPVDMRGEGLPSWSQKSSEKDVQ